MSPLQINVAASSITGDFSYTTSASCNSSLYLGNDTCTFSVVFSPTAAGVRTGVLTIISNDPANPSVAVQLSGTGYATYPVPSISQLDPPTFPAGSAAFTANIYGGPFFPTSVVKVNGQAQTTTYLSSSTLRAAIDPALRSDLGELTVTVSNPAPGGGESAAVTATLYRTLSVNASSMVYVPATNLLYATVGASASSNANTVVPIDPSTGTTKNPIAVGKDPRMLVASDDGKYLYVALQGDQTIQRIDLATSTIDRTFPFPPNQVEGGTMMVSDMHVIPGTSDALVVAVGGEVALYRDAGLVNAVPTEYPPVNVSSFAFTDDPGTAYALPFTDVQNHYFNIFTFDSSGVHYTRVTGTNFGPYDQTGAQVVSDGTLLYTNAGQVWNPATASLSGTFPVSTYNATSYPNLFSLIVDRTNARIYLMGNQNYGSGSSALTISAYDKTTLQNTGSLAFPGLQDPVPTNLARWGSDGLAFVGWDQQNFSINDVYLVRSRLVFQAPTPVVSLSAPSLAFDKQDVGTSSTPQKITLTNTGTATLTISSIMTTGPFSTVNDCGNSLAVGATCALAITFSPAAGGVANGVLTISDNSPSSPQSIALLGTGASPTFVLGAASGGSTTATVTEGQSATYNLSVAATPGFSGQVSLSCTGAPANAACSITPTSLTLSKGESANFTVSVTTQTTITASLYHSGNSVAAFSVLAMFGFPLFVMIGKPRPKHGVVMLIVLIGLVTFSSTACGGGGGQNANPPGPTPHALTTPQGTYTLVVTASSGSVSTSETLTLKVQ